jgi:hypothetical protein
VEKRKCGAFGMGRDKRMRGMSIGHGEEKVNVDF